MATSKKVTTAKKTTKSPAVSLPALGAPALLALDSKGIKNLQQLSKYSETELLRLHGMGKSSITKLQTALKAIGLSLKKADPLAPVTKPSDAGSVDEYMKKLKHPMKNVAAALIQLILAADKSVGQEIAWNAPSFFYTGPMKPFNPKEYKRFIVGFNFFKNDCLRIIFLTGAKLNDTSGLLEGDYADGRRLALFYSMEDVQSKGKILQQLIKKWLKMLDK